jgi:type I restriction enzyme S subunit
MSETWPICELGTLFQLRSEKSKQIKATEYLESGFLPVIDQSERPIAGYIDDPARAYSGPLPVIIFGDHTRATKFIEFPFGAGADGTQILAPMPQMDARFLYYVVSRSSLLIGNYGYDRHLKHLRRFKTPFPISVTEQRRIAEILLTLDESIEKAESLIAKYQQIKAGLMHDLFTRGVTADRKLRPPREQAPELYKETPIGWIPKEWGLERCGNLCTRICVGIVIQPTQYYVVDGIPAFRSANVREDGIDPTNFVYISLTANTSLAKSQVRTGDILSVRTGYPGTSAVVPMEFHGSNSIDILISSPGDRINSEFLCDWINSSFGKEQVLRQQGGMAQQHFNVGEMRELLVALPFKEEQQRIRDRTSSVEKKLRLERNLLQKLRCQKLGLMQDLLTGKVRVTAA